MTLLLTGASGFIGRAVRDELQQRNMPARIAVRRPVRAEGAEEVVVVGEIDGTTQWRAALVDVDVVVHVAGLAHVRGTPAELGALHRVNVEGTERLARAAAAVGIRRFVFLGSAKVSGDDSGERPFRETDPVQPVGPYAVSKWQAEERVRLVASECGLEYCIVRTPLVYGPGVRANFLALLNAVDRGWPLPFGAVRNARSLIYSRNLAHALLHCADHELAAGDTFFVKDEFDLSTADLIRHIATAMGRPARLFSVPPRLLSTLARAVGRGDTAARLLESSVVDDTAIRRRTDWRPPHRMDDGLAATAAWYRSTRGAGR